MDYEDILAGADPETIKAMVDAGLTGRRMALASQQAGLGNELLSTPSAQGREVGHTYVASSPLEHLSVALQKVVGAKKINDAMGQQQGLLNQQGQTMGAGWQQIIDAMRRRQQQQPQPQQPDLSIQAPVEQ